LSGIITCSYEKSGPCGYGPVAFFSIRSDKKSRETYVQAMWYCTVWRVSVRIIVIKTNEGRKGYLSRTESRPDPGWYPVNPVIARYPVLSRMRWRSFSGWSPHWQETSRIGTKDSRRKPSVHWPLFYTLYFREKGTAWRWGRPRHIIGNGFCLTVSVSLWCKNIQQVTDDLPMIL
jgi:hypothetical protein